MKYEIKADMIFIDGALAGLPLPNGWHTRYATADGAMHTVRWIDSLYESAGTVNAAGTGNQYRFTSPAKVTII